MNVNPDIQKLADITGLPVSPDLYSYDGNKYIVYEYTDERPVFWGDDTTLYDQATVRVSLYTPTKFNHMELKHQIRDYLETLGEVDDISSWIETYIAKNNLEQSIRKTTFDITITKER